MNVSHPPREQLFRLLSGEALHPPPVWLLFPYHSVPYYVDARKHPAYRRVHEASRGRAVILNRRNLTAPVFGADVLQRDEAMDEPGVTGRRTVLSHAGVALVSENGNGPDGARRKRLLADEEDLERLLSFPVETDPDVIGAALERQLGNYLREREEFPEDYGSMMLCLGEPIGWLYHNARLDEYPVWSLTHLEQIEKWLQRMMERHRAIYRWCLERELAEVYFLVGSELAAPPMVSRATFQRWIVPFAKELIAMIHDAGALAIQHYHGQIREILPDFLDMAPDALHTIEDPPVGNCTLAQAYEVVGDRIALVGNLQYDEFRSSTPSRIRQRVGEILEEVDGRRFLLSPTAGPFDPNPPERLIENYLAFLDAGSLPP